MTRSTLPIAHLAELPARQLRSQARVSAFDFVFLMTATLVVIFGCAFMLDLAAARSSGQASPVWDTLSNAAVWLPTMAKLAGKYILLFLASIVNSGLIVLLVQSLRTMDSKISQVVPTFSFGSSAKVKVGNVRGKRAHQRREASAIRESAPFLLSPVFR